MTSVWTMELQQLEFGKDITPVVHGMTGQSTHVVNDTSCGEGLIGLTRLRKTPCSFLP